MLMKRRAFTIIELLVVVSIIALLVGILLPAIGKARDQALLTRSVANLKEMGTAHAIYGAEWNDRQVTWVADDLSKYGTDPTSAFAGYAAAYGNDHHNMVLGWDANLTHWSYLQNPAVIPLNFSGGSAGWGACRVPNAWSLNQYMNGRFYDEIWYAPKDKAVTAAIEPCTDHPGDFCFPNAPTLSVMDASYSLSPAAMFSPAVMGFGTNATWVDPFSIGAGMRSPSVSAAAYPELKTRTIEHHWLNGDVRAECNGNFLDGQYNGCQPYYFNHSWHSVPQCLMFDGHVQPVGVREAKEGDDRSTTQTGRPLWSRNCGSLPDYFHAQAYDFPQFIGSFHMLTTDGIKGRDIDAR
jgi:prepilin-type N-terminal cleavage/methylation domain-containing protein